MIAKLAKLLGHKVIILRALLYVLLLASMLFTGIIVQATPTPYVTLVNHARKECVQKVILGDECGMCQPINGWEVLGFSDNSKCPENYSVVTKYDKKCESKECQYTPKHEPSTTTQLVIGVVLGISWLLLVGVIFVFLRITKSK